MWPIIFFPQPPHELSHHMSAHYLSAPRLILSLWLQSAKGPGNHSIYPLGRQAKSGLSVQGPEEEARPDNGHRLLRSPGV